MSDSVAALRLCEADAQGLFPWGDIGARKLVGLPPADILRWRGRMDRLKNPQFVVVRNADWPPHRRDVAP